jgi:hypothetical protein
VRVVFGALQAEPSADVTNSSLTSWGSETMFARDELPGGLEEFVAGWFAARAELSDAVTLLCSPFYAPFMYSDHLYAAIFQSAESIARARYTGAEKSRAEHRQRVARIAEAARAGGVPPEDVDWAEGILAGRNDKKLADLIGELVADAGALGEAILARDPHFTRTVASARARVSHPGGKQGLTTIQRYWYGQVLLWVVRARLAAETGLATDVISRQVIKRGSFDHAVSEIGPQ